MSGWTGTLWQQLRSDYPLCVVLYSDLAELEEVIETVMLVAPLEWHMERSRDLEDAFRKPNTPLLLTVEDEAAAIDIFDGRREQLADRTAPAVLFLLKGGSAVTALRYAPGLAGWLRGGAFDPEPAEIDEEREQASFHEETGRSPDEWIDAWRRGDIPDTLTNNFLYQRALLLERGGGAR